MRVSAEDIPKTSWSTKYDHCEYLVVPLGLTHALPAFISIMKDMLIDYNDSFVLVYLKDILVHSNSRG